MTLLDQMQSTSVLDAYRLFKFAADEYSSMGVTTAQSGGVGPALASGLYWFSRLGVVPQRLVLFPWERDYAEDLLNGDYDPADYTTDRSLHGAGEARSRRQHTGVHRVSE